MNGPLNRSNLYYLDGILDIEQQFNTYAVSPILDTLQEFKVDSHNDQAQFGQAMGGVVNMVTKSGTNKLHGSAWEFLRNKALDARNPFLSKVTPFKQNQFGVTIGGPVVLPHYNGRNKTFFYAGYEGYRNHTANELLYRTATAQELAGDLSDLGVPIYNPFSTRSDGEGGFVRDVFPENNISEYIDPGMLAFAKATFPAPVNTGVAGTNAINTDPYTVREDDLQVRVDERLGDKDYAFFRWSQRWQTRITPQQLLNLASTGAHRTHNYVGSCAGYYERLNVGGDWHVGNITPAAGFNTSAFAVPALYTYGNLGRNALRTGSFSNLDFSLFREFPLPRSETAKIQFRFEAFNTFNHPIWGTPVQDFNNTNFGRIFGTRSIPRQLQLALKFLF